MLRLFRTATPYETISGIQRTDQLFREYITRNFQNVSLGVELGNQAGALPTVTWTLFGLWSAIMITVLVCVVAVLRTHVQDATTERGSLE